MSSAAPATNFEKPTSGPSRVVIILLMMLLYPVGVILLWASPRFRTRGKILGTLLAPFFFGFVLLLALKPFWDFDGYFNLRSFALDFTKGGWHFSTLEQHRAKQKNAAVKPLSGELVADAKQAWTDFRGAKRDGIVENARVSTDWGKRAPRELWRQPVGEGYSSFVCRDGRAYTIEQRRKKEVIACYDIASGKEIWATEYDADFKETLGGDGPRATPTLSDDRLYSLGALGDLYCVDVSDGKVRWHKNVLKGVGAKNLTWAMSGSPLVVDRKVIVTSSGDGAAGVWAFDKDSGAEVWKSEAGRQGYVSLVLETLAGKRQVLNESAAALMGIDPDDGKVLWGFPWQTSMGINCSQPIVAGPDRVFLSSGYGQGCALIEIQPAGKGLAPKELWSNTKMKNKFSSSVIHDGHVYGLDEGVLACLRLSDGERMWKGEKYGHGSLLLLKCSNGNYPLVLSEEGQLALVSSDPAKFVEMGKIDILKGRTWNNFIVLGGLLLARNHKEMVCYDLAP